MDTSNGSQEPTSRRKTKSSAESTLELAGLHEAEPTSAAQDAQEAAAPQAAEAAPEPRETASENAASASAPDADASSGEPAADAAGPAAQPSAVAESAAEEGAEGESASSRADRRRIEEQLEALKRKESELRRALAIADHPELADAIRLLEGCVYGVTRVDEKIAQGLSKSEERRRETLEKKVTTLREKRAELDAQIAELDGELAQLGEERTRTFQAERRQAMERLVTTLGAHDAALQAAGLDPGTLVPQIADWLPEIRALAEELVAAHRGNA